MPFKSTPLGSFDNSREGLVKFSVVERSVHTHELTVAISASVKDEQVNIRIGGEGFCMDGGSIDLPKAAAKAFAEKLLQISA